ncbi:T9SS type A sorting domain-containing protein [Aurantibacillus circumpalustris]|uniref:T9SS type A sorting domain-containing protein n=1 Tax=Aurantibacillus circumpalustris TaxID=3036359 RepID=UPI00295A8797|nr:T9SS type A sorting domain-containing protein [Aurantibacillus circumpalustris]
MKITRKIYLLLVLFCSLYSPAQLEFSKWYFGAKAGLDFSTNPPTILTSGVLNTVEGCATISDNVGNLLFYTDGISVFNSTHSVMANGLGLFGQGSSTQSALIVKKPGSDSLYYVFTVSLQNSTNGANYSIVDMSLAAGLGSVTVKNSHLYDPSCERQVAVRHCNGKDVWVVSHHYGSNEFRAYLLNSNGVISSPVVSAIGESMAGTGLISIGQLKVSPDGKKLAMASATTSIPQSLGSGGFHLFDFNAANGTVSNSLTLLSGTNIPNSGAYGVEFSPDGSKLYGAAGPMISATVTGLYQWDICAANNQAIIASQYSINTNGLYLGSIQRAINGKLYLTASGPGQQFSLSVIHNPNASGVAMGFTLNGQNVAPKFCALGLPNFINTYTRPLPTPFTNSLACQTSSFSVPPVPTFSSGCTSTPYSPSSYAWDFGEPAAGAANSSTLGNPVHTYSTTGTYTVSLILYGACTNDTLKKVITISTPGPTVNVAGNFALCKGEKNTFTVSGANTYLWSTNSTASTVALNPTATTPYSVSGTLNGCTLSKTFTVEVNPCLGISAFENKGDFRVFPNPFSDLVSVEAIASSTLMIFDLNGKLLLQSNLNKGQNQINTSELKSGVYFIQAQNAESVWRGRFVKLE